MVMFNRIFKNNGKTQWSKRNFFSQSGKDNGIFRMMAH